MTPCSTKKEKKKKKTQINTVNQRWNGDFFPLEAWCLPDTPKIMHEEGIYFTGSAGSSLVAQWLRFCASNAGGVGSTPGQGTRSHILVRISVCYAAQPKEKIKKVGLQQDSTMVSKYLFTDY